MHIKAKHPENYRSLTRRTKAEALADIARKYGGESA